MCGRPSYFIRKPIARKYHIKYQSIDKYPYTKSLRRIMICHQLILNQQVQMQEFVDSDKSTVTPQQSIDEEFHK
jgi:hypothetical protein